MPGEPGRAPPPTAVEVWPSVAPFGEDGRISVSIIVLAFPCSSAGSTFASPGVISNEPGCISSFAIGHDHDGAILIGLHRAPSQAGMRAVVPRERQLRRRHPPGQRRAAGPPAPPARPQPVHRWWPNPIPSRNQAPRGRSHRSDVDAALGCHHMRSSATPPVASVTPNLLLLEIRRAFAAYSLPSRSPSSLGRRACSLACRPRPTVVPPPCDAAPTTAGRLLEAVLPADAEPIRRLSVSSVPGGHRS